MSYPYEEEYISGATTTAQKPSWRDSFRLPKEGKQTPAAPKVGTEGGKAVRKLISGQFKQLGEGIGEMGSRMSGKAPSLAYNPPSREEKREREQFSAPKFWEENKNNPHADLRAEERERVLNPYYGAFEEMQKRDREIENANLALRRLAEENFHDYEDKYGSYAVTLSQIPGTESYQKLQSYEKKADPIRKNIQGLIYDRGELQQAVTLGNLRTMPKPENTERLVSREEKNNIWQRKYSVTPDFNPLSLGGEFAAEDALIDKVLGQGRVTKEDADEVNRLLDSLERNYYWMEQGIWKNPAAMEYAMLLESLPTEGFVNTLRKTGSSVVGNLLSSPVYAIENFANAVKNVQRGQNKPVPLESEGSVGKGRSKQQMQSALSQKSPGEQFAWSTGASIANNILNFALFGKAAPFIMATQAGTDAAYDVAKRGGSGSEQLVSGVLAGGAEYLGEKVSLEGLENLASAPRTSAKSFIKGIAAQMGTEFTEEAATEAMNILSDMAVMGNRSEMARYFDRYLEEHPEKKNDDAFWSTLGVALAQVGQAGLAGAISGGIMGGGAQVYNRLTGGGMSGDSMRTEPGFTSNPPDVTAPSPQQAGAVTTIYHPYTGVTPVMEEGVSKSTPVIAPEAVQEAEGQILLARQRSEQTGKSLRNYLSDFYNTLFDRTGGVRDIPIEGLNFQGEEYSTRVNKNVVRKVISDPALSPEKLSVFHNIDEVIQNANYVGSGEFVNHGNRQKNVIRYDYFETPAQIAGKDYIVAFDVEVIPGTNNYRTHRVVQEIDLVPTSHVEVGPVPTAQEGTPGLPMDLIPISSADTRPVRAAVGNGSDPSNTSIHQAVTGVNTSSMQPDGNYATVAAGNRPLVLGDGDSYNGTRTNTGGLRDGRETGQAVIHRTEGRNLEDGYLRGGTPEALERTILRGDPTSQMGETGTNVTGEERGVPGGIESPGRGTAQAPGYGSDTLSRGRTARVPETLESFLRRAEEAGKRIREVGNGIYSYRELSPGSYSPELAVAQRELARYGAAAVVVDGAPEYYRGGMTQVGIGESSTLPDGSVLIRSDTTMPPLEIAGHEGYHSLRFTDPQRTEEFYQLFETFKITDPAVAEQANKVSEAYWGKDFDITTDYPKLYEELAGYVSGWLSNDPVDAAERCGDWFYDFDEVAAAWRRMHDGLPFSSPDGDRSDNAMRATAREPSGSPYVSTQEGSNVNLSSPFGENTVGSAERTATAPYERLVMDYGAIPEGENPARVVDVPQATEAGKTRRFVRTVMEAEGTPDGMLGSLEQEIRSGTFAYQPASDAKATSAAEKVIERRGLAGALSYWETRIESGEAVSKNDIALAEQLYIEAANAGDTRLAMKLAAEIAAEGTRSGQNVQAMQLLKKMTPEGQMYYIDRTVQHLQKEMETRYRNHPERMPELMVDPELRQRLLAAQTPAEAQAISDEIYKQVASQLPATWYDKWNAWRYLSMLGNPKTHIRNVVGNLVFQPAVRLKNLIKTGLEAGYNGIQGRRGGELAERTAAILTPKDQALRDFAKNDFAEMREVIMGTGKLNPASIIRDHQQIFKTKLLEKGRRSNPAILDFEDRIFSKMTYTDSLAQYMKANGYTAEFLESGTKAANQALEAGRSYAIKEAQKATYRDYSAIAASLNQLKNKNAVTKLVGEGLLPFTKTPANVLKRGIEYSPIGVAKGIKEMAFDVKAGRKTASEAIDSLASGLSGSLILGLGMLLQSLGLISGGGEDDQKEDQFARLQGAQDYALQIGDISYTIDWAAPTVLPLFIGVELQRLLEEEGEFSPSDAIEALQRLGDPVIEMSMLQGVQNAFDAISYSDGKLGAFIANAVGGYVSQGVPTLAGQIARTIDPVRRNSYYVDPNSPLPASAQRLIQKNQAKIPGLSYGLEPYIDAWGRKDERDPGLRALENFLSPGYVSKTKITPADKVVNALYESTGEKAVLPSAAPKSFAVDGEAKHLTAKEYTEFSTVRGQTAHQMIGALENNRDYQGLAASDQVALVQKIYQYATAMGKEAVSSYEPDGWIAKARAAGEVGIPPEEYLIYAGVASGFSADRDRAGKAISGSKKAKVERYIDSLPLNRRQREYLLEALI